MKKIAYLIALVMLISLFSVISSGCRGSEDAGGKTVIDYWSIYPDTDEMAPKHKALIDEFEAKNPDIKVNHHGYNFWDYFTAVNNKLLGGEEIDIFWNDITDVKYRAGSEVTLNLNPLIERDGIDLSTWTKSTLDTASYEGGLYALPVETDVRMLFYNKDLFKAAGLDPEKPPKTFEEMKEYAAKMTKDSENGKSYSQIGFHPMLGSSQIQCVLWNMGGEFFDASGKPTLNSSANIKAIQWWIEMNRVFDTRKNNAFTTEHSDGAAKDQSFQKGVNAMVIDESGLAWRLAKVAPELNYGVAPIPYNDEKHRTTWSGAFTLEIFNRSSSEKQEAAWKFMQYMTSEEIQIRFMNELEFTPANLKALEILKATANENQKTIIDEFKYARHMQYCKESPQWWGGLGNDIFNACGEKDKAGKLVDPATSAKNAADKAQSDLEKAIKEYNDTH